MRVSIRGMMVVLLVVMSSTSSFAQSDKSWEEDSVEVLAQVEEFQLKIDKIRKSGKVVLVVLGVSGVVFITHWGIVVAQELLDGGTLFDALFAYNQAVQIEGTVFYGIGVIAVIQGNRIRIIELRRWLLLKPYNRRYLKLEDGYEVVAKDS